MTPARGQCILALVVLAAPWGAAGQVRLAQDGRALDANPYVGGGGYNVTYPGRGFLDSQLFVDRQVSGLAGFRGAVGYYPVDQLNLALPSDTMETFRRESVGAQDVLRGQTYAPAPYYDPTRTIVGLRSIVSGRAVPGSSVPQPLPPAGLFGQGGTVVYTPLALTPATGLVGSGLRRTAGSFLRFDMGDIVAADRAASGRLFAVPDAAQRERLAHELNQVQLPTDLKVKSEVEARIDPSAAAERHLRTALPGWEAEPNEPNAAARAAGGQALYLRRGTVPPAPNQDVFSDMLLQLRGGMMGPAGTFSPLPSPSPPSSEQPAQGPEALPSSAAERIRARQPQLRTPLPAPGEEQPLLPARGTLVGYSPGGVLLVRGLGGQGRDEFNITMTQADHDLKAGRYYDAAEGYRRAAAIQPDNPLPRVGLSLTLFGTGQSLGAARQLRRAAEIFPTILTSRLDIASMSDAELMTRRLDFLATRLATSATGTERLLYFIAAYLHANLGQDEQAKDYALKLQAAAAEDTVLADYARFLLTGQTTSAPASQAASQPASQPTTAPLSP